MKRTGEVALGVIGVVFYGLGAFIGFILLGLKNNDDLAGEINADPKTAEAIDYNILVNFMSTSGWTLIITSLIALILGIIALVFIKGETKKPKPAGIIFIVTAVVITIATFGVGFLPGLCFLIAGIMCLVRKPPQLIA